MKNQQPGYNQQSSRYDNNHGGARIAFSIGGLLTGEGGDTVIIDDPLDADDSLNINAIRNVNEWYSSTLTTRLNDQEESSVILIMQRLNVADLSGYLLDGDKFIHLCLPMEYEVDRKCKTLIFEDPRTKENERHRETEGVCGQGLRRGPGPHRKGARIRQGGDGRRGWRRPARCR